MTSKGWRVRTQNISPGAGSTIKVKEILDFHISGGATQIIIHLRVPDMNLNELALTQRYKALAGVAALLAGIWLVHSARPDVHVFPASVSPNERAIVHRAAAAEQRALVPLHAGSAQGHNALLLLGTLAAVCGLVRITGKLSTRRSAGNI